MLSSSKHFLFIHVPKTGGNAIQKVLAPFSDDRIVCIAPHHDGVERFEVRSDRLDIQKHSTLCEYSRQLTVEEFGRLFRFSCVRNPWARCVSHFYSPHRGPVEFNEAEFGRFIETAVQPVEHFWSLSDGDADPAVNLDFIIAFETLDADFEAVRERLGFGGDPLVRRNASRARDFREYFTRPEFVDVVAERFKYEIERFDYMFE